MDLGFLEKIKQSISDKKNSFIENFNKIFSNSLSDNYISMLSDFLLKSDIGFDSTEKIINSVKKKKNKDINDLKNNLFMSMHDVLAPCEKNLFIDYKPFIILVVGVNGVGKTTTVSKIANLYKNSGKNVAVVAADTFRAAAIEQLSFIAEKNGIHIIKQHYGADSSSVIFDAVKISKNSNFDILVVDTSGRFHTDNNLMLEFKKIDSVLKKIDPLFPNEVMMVIDSNIGQNSLSQIKNFNNYIKITGLCISKFDCFSKSGSIFSISDNFKIPIRYICDGEDINDIKKFDSKLYLSNLFRSF